MKNKGIWLVVAIVVILIIASGNFITFPFVTVGNPGIAKPCSEAVLMATNGAMAGECFVGNDGYIERPTYVRSVVENQRTGPSGLEAFCKIDTCYSCDEVFTCTNARDADNTFKKVCKDNSDCDGYKCINNFCTNQQLGGCTIKGELRCADEDSYQRCLDNNQWSGLFGCSMNYVCDNGKCVIKNKCTVNSKRCIDSTRYQVCEDSGEWSVMFSCSTDKTCSNGICVTSSSSSSSSSGGSSSSSSGGGTTSNFDWNTKTIGNLPLWGLLAIILGIFLMIVLVKKK